MKLLFDQNVSRKLVARLADVFPGSTHVIRLVLDRSDDGVIWKYAADHGYVIVTKDEGLCHRARRLKHPPPKVIGLKVGNTATDEIEALIREDSGAIAAFADDPNRALLVIGRR